MEGSFLLQYEEEVSFKDEPCAASRTLTVTRSLDEEGDQDFATMQLVTMTMTRLTGETDQDASNNSFFAIPR